MSFRPSDTARTIVAKLSSVRIMRPAFFATWVPVPMAIPMSAALIAGASLTPSPVMATTSPFLRNVSTISTLCSGATRPTTPMSSIRRSRSSSDIAASSVPRMASPGMPSCLATAAPRHHVVTGDHAHSDVRLLSGLDGIHRLRPRRVDHADDGGQFEVGDVGEQVAIGIEIARGQVPMAPAMIRSPSPPRRSICALARVCRS